MIDWIKKLLADAQGIPDELRASYLGVHVFYLLVWTAWLLAGNIDSWPDHIAAFVGGQAGLITAFGAAILTRGKN